MKILRVSRWILPIFILLVSTNPIVKASEQSVVQMVLAARELAGSGKYDKAYEEANEALALSTTSLDQPHLYTAFINDDLAKSAIALGRYKLALEHSDDAFALLSAVGDEAKQYESDILFNRASALTGLGRYREAVPVFESVYRARKQMPDINKLASSAQALGFAYLEFESYRKAREKLTESVRLWKQLGDSVVSRQIDSLISLSKIPLHLDSAKETLKLVEKIRDEFIGQLSGVQQLQISLAEASAYILLSDLNTATSVVSKAEIDISTAMVISTLDRARISYTRGVIAVLRGDAIGAEKSFRTNLTMLLETESENHPVVLRSMRGLAIAKKNLGALGEANDLFEKIISVLEKNMGENHVSVAMSLAEWTRVLSDEGKHEESIAAAERAYRITKSDPTISTFNQGIANNVLAFSLKANDQFDKAEAFFQEGTNAIVLARGDNSSDLPPGYIALAELALNRKALELARSYISRALSIIEKDASTTPDRAVHATVTLALIEATSGECDLAYAYIKKSLDYSSNYSSESFKIMGSVNDSKTQQDRKYIADIYEVLHECGQRIDPVEQELAFTALQIPQLKTTSAAVGLSGLSLTPSDSDLKKLVDEREILRLRWRSLDSRISGILTSTEDSSQVNELAKRLSSIGSSIDELNIRITDQFPAYAELLNPQPISVEEIQSVLDEDMATLLQFTYGDSTELAMVLQDRVLFARTDLSESELTAAVESIRNSMIRDARISTNEKPSFDYESSFMLYKKLIAPFESQLKSEQITHILLIPDGAAQRLPFALLMDSVPKNKPSSFRSLNRLNFLVKQYSLSVLPSLNSALRLSQLEKETQNTTADAFIGFGDPLFDGLKRKDSRSHSAFEENAESRINLDELRRAFSRIEETADELKQIAEIFPERSRQLYLEDEATELNVKNADLSDFGVVAFATHGVMADQFANLREPALIFTPPVELSDEDDGLLTASEIALLDLNADWVILSACNTASPVPEQGADGLSGLARAFFYAGARSILVTHWEVESRSAQILSTNAISAWLDDERTLDKSASLRESMLYLLDGEEGSRYSHPYYWAPFTNVGLR